MKKFGRRVIPVLLAVAMTAGTMTAYADDNFTPGPGKPYDDATEARIRDNVLEYDEISLLIDQYNTTLENMRDSYSDNRESYKSINKLKEQMADASGALLEQSGQMSDMANMFKNALGYQTMVTPSAYADMVYASEMLSLRADQTLLQADAMTEMTPQMMKIKMVDTVRCSLISGAQSAMIGYEQMILNKAVLEDSISLLEAVCRSTELQAAQGLATQNDVLKAKQNLESVQANKLSLDAGEQKLRQTLCTMMGWEYNDIPEIQKIPEADLSRIDGMNPETDREAAIANNLTLRYNRLDYENKTDGSVEKINLKRTMEAEEAEIASSLTNLYNSVLQKRNEYETAQAAYELEKVKMDTAERKRALGMIGNLEYLQQKNSCITKEVNVRSTELSLFQAMETYDWAVKGNLSLSQ